MIVKIRILLLLPLCISIAYLLLSIPFRMTGYHVDTSPFIYVPAVLAIIVPMLMVSAARIKNDLKNQFSMMALLSPCFLAPLAVIYPWAVVPGNLGVGLAGFQFFLVWLNKYPNAGPVNIQVMLGIICVILACWLPTLFAFIYSVQSRTLNRKLVILCGAQIVIMVPIIINLDFGLLWCGIIGFSGFGDEFKTREVMAATGPLFRLISMVIMVKLTVRSVIISKRK